MKNELIEGVCIFVGRKSIVELINNNTFQSFKFICQQYINKDVDSNMLTNKDVAIFGVNWPEVDGVAYIYQCIE